ncbi:MAG: DNA polymerase III subunit beta [Sphingomonadales bacterium 32-68-7]|nr:MAG: DNA polymerase III subunit beta [Sphingomonadales bacterium 12-68-11]OYX09280.1 MAG: DNA polymerase III subunit beta [Sphingomonadales bacterium 32-68-7]
MDRQTVLHRLNGNKDRLQALGLKRLSVFGSTARGDAAAHSDVDLAVTLDEDARIDLFRFAAISEQVSRILGVPVDLVVEPARNPRMQAQIDRDRLRVY